MLLNSFWVIVDLSHVFTLLAIENVLSPVALVVGLKFINSQMVTISEMRSFSPKESSCILPKTSLKHFLGQPFISRLKTSS